MIFSVNRDSKTERCDEMDIIIKQASVDDIETLMEWRMEVLHHVFEVPDDENMQGLYQANREYYLSAMPDLNHVAIFATVNQTVVGCGGLCLYQEMPSPDNLTGQCAYLMNIYTREEYRKQGVGKAVAMWLVDYAKKKGITKIYLETSVWGRPLYESLGFHDMQDFMKM